MIALTVLAHQPWPVSVSAFLLQWNMTVDYLACLAMKLLCFVFSSRGAAGGWGKGLGDYERDTIVLRTLSETGCGSGLGEKLEWLSIEKLSDSTN